MGMNAAYFSGREYENYSSAASGDWTGYIWQVPLAILLWELATCDPVERCAPVSAPTAPVLWKQGNKTSFDHVHGGQTINAMNTLRLIDG
jgi:hypothetical protein